MPEWVRPCAGKGRFPWVIRPKKDFIKLCETYFANTLNLNDKGPSLKRVCFPKFYSPLANCAWLRNSPCSSLYVFIIWSLLPGNDWCALPVFLCKLNPKKPLKKRLLALLLWEIDHLSSPRRYCLGRLILIHGGRGSPMGRASTQVINNPVIIS